MTTAQTEARAVVAAWLQDESTTPGVRMIAGYKPSGLVKHIAAALAAKDAELAALKKEAAAFAEKVQDYSNDGHLARAARSFLDKWEGRDG